MFNPFKKKPQKPAYLSESMRDTVWGDRPMDSWPPDGTTGKPWDTFAQARELVKNGKTDDAIQKFLTITEMADLESRHYLQAWFFLRQLKHPVPENKQNVVYGIIVEAAMATGFDLMAAYHDHHARFYSHVGGGTIWERPDGRLDKPIDTLFNVGQQVANILGTEEKPRPAIVTNKEMRFTMLTPGGMGFGQGTEQQLVQDAKGRALLLASVNLLNAITEITKQNK
jgi:hypothetical protein